MPFEFRESLVQDLEVLWTSASGGRLVIKTVDLMHHAKTFIGAYQPQNPDLLGLVDKQMEGVSSDSFCHYAETRMKAAFAETNCFILYLIRTAKVLKWAREHGFFVVWIHAESQVRDRAVASYLSKIKEDASAESVRSRLSDDFISDLENTPPGEVDLEVTLKDDASDELVLYQIAQRYLEWEAEKNAESK